MLKHRSDENRHRTGETKTSCHIVLECLAHSNILSAGQNKNVIKKALIINGFAVEISKETVRRN